MSCASHPGMQEYTYPVAEVKVSRASHPGIKENAYKRILLRLGILWLAAGKKPHVCPALTSSMHCPRNMNSQGVMLFWGVQRLAKAFWSSLRGVWGRMTDCQDVVLLNRGCYCRAVWPTSARSKRAQVARPSPGPLVLECSLAPTANGTHASLFPMLVFI